MQRPTGTLWANKWMYFVVLLVPLLTGLALIYAVKIRKSQPRMKSFKNVKFTRVTDENNVETAASSPDGSYFAYTIAENGKRSLWAKHQVTGERSQIVAPQDAYSMNVTAITGDGFIYYTMNDEANPQGALFRVSSQGGTPQKLLSRVSRSVALSQDGKQIAFVRHYVSEAKDELFIANTDGSHERLLLSVNKPNWLGDAAPAWSPDESIVAVGYGTEDRNEVTGRNLGMTPLLVSVMDGKFKPLSRSRWLDIGQLSWLNDGSGLMFVAQQQILNPAQLWQMSYPKGDSQQITNDSSSYVPFSLTKTQDDSTILLVQKEGESSIWVATVGQPGSEKTVTSGNSLLEGSRGLAWTSDGRIVFDANVNGKAGLWAVSAEGGETKALINNETDDVSPETSRDGRQMVFGSYRTGRMQVWRANPDGTLQRKLTSESRGVASFSLSPEGQWVVYAPLTGGIRKMSIDGGAPVDVITKANLGYPQVSPDGKFVAYLFNGEQSLRPKIGIVEFENGTPFRTIDLPLTAQPDPAVFDLYRGWHWSPDGRAIVYVNTLGGVSNLWSQAIEGGAAKQITEFKSDHILNFAFSPDGRQIAFSRSSHSSNVVMISAGN